MTVKNLKISPIFMKIGIQGFFGSLITNLQSNFQKSRWRVQHGGQKFENQSDFHENWYTGVFRVADYEFINRFSKFKMADQPSNNM